MNPRWCWAIPLAFGLVCGVVRADGRWQQVAPGFELYEGTFLGSARSPNARIVAIRLDVRYYSIRIADASQLSADGAAPARQSNYSGGILRGLLKAPRVAAAINGGFITSYAFPQPLGLVRIKSVTLAPVSKGRLLSGFICVAPSGEVRISWIAEWPIAKCRDALQAGPLIVEPTRKKGIGEFDSKRTPFIRSVVCTDDGGVIFVRSEEATLFDLMNVLIRSDAQQGIGCNVALNLGGDSDSGILWREGSGLRSEGSLDASLATAIVAYKR